MAISMEATDTTIALLETLAYEGHATLWTSSSYDSLQYSIKLRAIFFISGCLGTEGEARTPDSRFWRPVLYQLSYFRVKYLPGSGEVLDLSKIRTIQ